MDRNFGGVIWTDHALQRLRERGISQGDAWATWRNPEQSRKGNLHKSSGAWRYYKTYGDQIIEVVAEQNNKKEWVIISVWSRPVQNNEQYRTSHHTQEKRDMLFVRILKKLLKI